MCPPFVSGLGRHLGRRADSGPGQLFGACFQYGPVQLLFSGTNSSECCRYVGFGVDVRSSHHTARPAV